MLLPLLYSSLYATTTWAASMLIGPQAKIRSGPFTGEQPSYPLTSAAFLSATGITPTSLYTCLDASGTLVDVVGGNNLTIVTGTPKFRQDVGGSVGISYDGASNTGHSGSSVNEPGTNSILFGVIGTWGTVFGGTNPGMVGKVSTTTVPNCFIYRASDTLNYPSMQVKGNPTGSLLLTDVSVNMVSPVRPILVIGQIDRTNTTARLLAADSNKLLTLQSGSIAGFSTFTGGTAPQWAIAAGTGAVFKGGFKCSYSFYATGAQCEGTNIALNVAKRLGFAE